MTTDVATDPLRRILGGEPDSPELIFERRLRTDPDDAWQAITDPERLARWFGRLRGEPPRAVGDAYEIDLGGEADVAVGTVVACREPEHLAVDWSWQGEPAGRIDASLAGDADGTTLVLRHRLSAPDHAVGYGGGWEEMVTALVEAVDPDQADSTDHATLEAAGNREWTRLLNLRRPENDVRVTRTVPAEPDQIWSALTTVEGLATWWWTHLGAEYAVDARVGGEYRFTAPSAGFEVHGRYLELEPGRRAAFSWTWQDADGDGPTDLVEVTLTPEVDGTRVEVRHRGPWEDAAQPGDYRTGWETSLDALVAATDPDRHRNP